MNIVIIIYNSKFVSKTDNLLFMIIKSSQNIFFIVDSILLLQIVLGGKDYESNCNIFGKWL